MSIEVTKGDYKTTLELGAQKDTMLYCVDLNASIAFKFIFKGEKNIGILGIDVPEEKVKKLLSQYMCSDYKSIMIEIVGGDGSSDANNYLQMLQNALKESKESWNGTLDISYKTNDTIHPNFIALLGDESGTQDIIE